MAYFKAVGKYIDNCGLTNIMVDCEMIANGSVNGYLIGKHFNRCKSFHPIVSLALQILHFQSFVNEKNVKIRDNVKKYLEDLKKNKSVTPAVLDNKVLILFEEYEKYKQQTMNSKTAQYYIVYINLIDYYFMLNTNIRTGNFELFKYILPKITNLFFLFNRPNYARYLVKYHDNLLKIDETYPGLRDQLKKGSFDVKRTNKNFSRQLVELTLEQTINADAANKLTGIIQNTNSIAAR